MYLVTIENNGVETVINEVSTNTTNRISGTIKQGINTIDSFTFTIYPNNKGYNLISSMSTIVKVFNTQTCKYEFIGRVLNYSNSMDSNGVTTKTFICESELGYLLDTQQIYEEVHNISVRDFLEKLIKVHNSNTDTHKTFTVGNVNVKDNNDSLYRYIAYDTTKKNIDDDLISKLGGELKIRYENNIRYLDYLEEVGKVCKTEIRLSKNLKDITQDIDLNGYCNRLLVLGSKLKEKDEKGNEIDTEHRLTIESVNNGSKFIDDVESISKFGIIQGQAIFDDVTKAENLLNKGLKYLLNQRILISNKVNALDLSLIGIDINSFEVGNYYPLIHEVLGINDVVRIIEKTISIDNPHTSSITLGDKEKDIKSFQLNVKSQANKTALLEGEVTLINKAVANNNELIIDVNKGVEGLGKVTNSSIEGITKSIKTLTESIEIVNNSLNSINSSLKEINEDLKDLDDRLKVVEGVE